MVDISVQVTGFEDGVELPDLGNELVDYVLNELLERIKRRTPVRTGRAQAGWEITEQSITNDVPYVVYLEHGWSQQAPSGMIRISLEEVDSIIADYFREQHN